MADGSEGKTIDTQQVPVDTTPRVQSVTATQSTASVSERRGNLAADAETKRRRQALELQRERILSERTSSPHRRTALETALVDIEEKLTELGWVLHL
jgi:hypothetical protein